MIVLVLGCATAPGVPAERVVAALSPDRVRFELTGRIGVQNGDEGMSGLLRWLHAPEADELWFSSPLGSSLALLTRDDSGVELASGNAPPRRAADAETLTREALGWDLPLSGLEYWILAQPAPGSRPQRIERDPASGRLALLMQDGWRIEFLRYLDTERGALPGLIYLEYGSLQIRLAVDHWDVQR